MNPSSLNDARPRTVCASSSGSSGGANASPRPASRWARGVCSRATQAVTAGPARPARGPRRGCLSRFTHRLRRPLQTPLAPAGGARTSGGPDICVRPTSALGCESGDAGFDGGGHWYSGRCPQALVERGRRRHVRCIASARASARENDQQCLSGGDKPPAAASRALTRCVLAYPLANESPGRCPCGERGCIDSERRHRPAAGTSAAA
jgi:hypothetical protein